jgi:L-asparaginase II
MGPNDTLPLTAVVRGSVAERIHRGAYVAVSATGDIVYARGNPHEGVQGVGVPELGIGIAVKVADGDGTTRSAATVRALMAVAGDLLGREALTRLWDECCPPVRTLRGDVVGKVEWLDE